MYGTWAQLRRKDFLTPLLRELEFSFTKLSFLKKSLTSWSKVSKLFFSHPALYTSLPLKCPQHLVISKKADLKMPTKALETSQ